MSEPPMCAATRKQSPGRRSGQPETEQSIRNAALRLFAERGYANTSIRAVAEAAVVDPALVLYYFTSKDELFRRVLAVPVDPDHLIASVMAVERADAPYQLIRTYLELWSAPDTGLALTGFLRRVISEPDTLELMRDFVGSVVLQRGTAFLLQDVDPAEARLRVELVMSHAIGLLVLRTLFKIEPIASLTPDQVASLVAPTIAHYLDGDLSLTPSPDINDVQEHG